MANLTQVLKEIYLNTLVLPRAAQRFNTRLKYSSAASNYLTGIIKEKTIESPFTDISINTTDNLKTFLWSKAKWMDNKALICGITGASYSYGELKILTETFGNVLLQNGFKQRQVIALALYNSIETPVILLGAIAAGLSVCSINPEYTPGEMKQYIQNSGAVGIITCPSNLSKVEELISNLGRPLKVIVTPEAEGINKKTASTNSKIDIMYYEDLIKEHKHEEIQISTKSDDLFHISHSSGTTGLPKAVWLSHGNFVNNITAVTSTPSIALQNFATENFQEVIPIFLPIFHNYALMIVLKSLYLGSKIIILPKFEGSSFLNVLEKYQATVLYTVPPIVQYLFSNPNLNNNHKKNIKFILCAAAPLTLPNFKENFKNVFPTTKCIEGYGLTEGTCFVTLNSTENPKPNSVGIPISNTKLKIANLDHGGANDPNVEGEICFKGPQMTKGYMNNPKANEESIDKDGWFHTGDIGYYDKEGYLYVADRLKDMIKVKGFQVVPAELEGLLMEHEYITDAAVVGMPHPLKGEAPVAFVTTNKEINEKQLEEEIIKFMKTLVVSYKQIEKVIIVDKIPKTLSGKIKKQELKKLLKK